MEKSSTDDLFQSDFRKTLEPPLAAAAATATALGVTNILGCSCTSVLLYLQEVQRKNRKCLFTKAFKQKQQ